MAPSEKYQPSPIPREGFSLCENVVKISRIDWFHSAFYGTIFLFFFEISADSGGVGLKNTWLKLREKLSESLNAVLPILGIVLVL
ncbi:MAG: hypothetical protein ACI4PV_05605, partial [Butyricicoccus sp.]